MMANIVLKVYDSFNQRRYSNPWVAEVGEDGKPDFSKKTGFYTGGYNAGEAGELIVIAPEEGRVYMYGQKDYRGNNTTKVYAVFKFGEFVPVEKTELSKYL